MYIIKILLKIYIYKIYIKNNPSGMEETERLRDRWRKQRERESLYCQSGNDLMVVVFMNNREMKRQMEETERWMKQRWERWRKQRIMRDRWRERWRKQRDGWNRDERDGGNRERWERESLHWQSGNNLMDVAFINNNISFTSLQVLWKFQKSFYCNFDWQLNQNIRVTTFYCCISLTKDK